ncbi:MAG: hypothetical protein V1789_08575 [PVC group bacterium]
MKTKLICFLAAATLTGLIAGSPGMSQDVPGFSLGGFFEYRIENEVSGDDIAFMYYGARIKFRDERWIEAFIDGGGERLSYDLVQDKTTGCFGLGGTFWLMRGDPGYGPFDLGIFGSAHFSDYSSVKIKDTDEKTDIKHFRYMGQLVTRGYINQDFRAFVKGGIQYTKLEPGDDQFDDDDLAATKPAVNAGVEIQLVDNLIGTLELNYSESVGAAIHLDYWF